ncbi:MAG: PleD family two-component system response regulator [Candidatus Binatia bacterium]
MQKRLILVIDDDPSMCELVTAILTAAGYEVISAPNGLPGIEMARAAQPAVILLDMILPELDGVSTCQRLKQDPILGDIPVVGITASSDFTHTEKAFHAGSEFFVSKPFLTESLLQVVDMAVDTAEKRSPGQRLHPRFQAEVPVRCRVGADANRSREVVGTTRNLSLGGLLLFLPEKLAPGTVVCVHIDLPEGPIIAHSAVIWHNPQPRGAGKIPHGIRFLSFTDAGLVQYRRFLSQFAAGSAV